MSFETFRLLPQALRDYGIVFWPYAYGPIGSRWHMSPNSWPYSDITDRPLIYANDNVH